MMKYIVFKDKLELGILEQIYQ